MGDMTVAYPTTGIAVPQREAPALVCSSCGTHADAPREPFCAHCGSRISVSVRGGIASIAATRSLQFAVLAVVTNILVGGASFGVVYLLSDAARLTEAALGLEAVRFLVVGALLAVAIRYGIRGLKHTRDGALRRRPWAILGLAISGFYALLIGGSFAATAVLYLFVL
jgi:DNA-directed RNA polymerase subunit RPC12/RpoP